MTILEWLVENMRKLQEAGADSPRRDCLVFLEDTLRKDRSWVVTNPKHMLSSSQLAVLDGLIRRRLKREPLAYIRGKAWFYGRFFDVNSSVLIPRPESEAFIEQLKQIVDSKKTPTYSTRIIDIGTGSGCLAITAKLEFPKTSVSATDIDKKSVAIARQNAANHNVDVAFITSDLLTSVDVLKYDQKNSKKIIILIVNLPYVPEKLAISPEILFEPKKAIFSGKDGLDLYKKFWLEISNLLLYPQHILTESLESQHKQMIEIAKQAGYTHKRTGGLIQYFEKK